MKDILNAALLVAVTVWIGNVILHYGHRPEELQVLLEPTHVELPPMEIRQIAHAMDMGFDVSDEALDKLSAYIESNQTEWNAWCELERKGF